MRRFFSIIGLLILSLVVIIALAVAPAFATRPMVGFHYKDECRNIKGKQPAYLLYGTGPYRLNLSTKRPHDCIVVNRMKG